MTIFKRKNRLPIIRSSETAEEALACVAMICHYHNRNVDMAFIRESYTLSKSGLTISHLMDLSNRQGLSCRVLRVELDRLSRIKTPAILYWDFNHYVVLKSVSRRHVVIHDPKLGRRKIRTRDASAHFTGIALELVPSVDFVAIISNSKINIFSLWSTGNGFLTSGVHVFLSALAMQVTVALMPLQFQLFIDHAIKGSETETLTVIAVSFGFVVLMQGIFSFTRDWTIQVLARQFSLHAVSNIMAHMGRLPVSFFERRNLGDIISRVNSTSAIKDAVTNGIATTIIDGIMSVTACSILFFYSPLLATIVILSLILMQGVTAAAHSFSRERELDSLDATSSEQTFFIETIRAASTIRVMSDIPRIEGVWRNLYNRSVNASLSVSRVELANKFIHNIIQGGQTVLVLYLATNLVLAEQGFTVGMLVSFMTYRGSLTNRIMSLIHEVRKFRLLEVHLERLSDIICARPETTVSGWRPATPVEFQGGISLNGVSFRYGENDQYVLRDLNLDIRPGEFVAIVGASGCGKSTLMSLLLGLYAPTEGAVVLDGLHADPDLWREWRKSVGAVRQDDKLLSGTLADNISFFDPAIDMAAVQRAANEARIHEDITQMPMQYLSLTGDMGSSLSGGQRQRILLARALYRNPKVLVLDEGTANLDERTEEAIASHIAAMPITRVVVTHRPALVRKADRVVEVRGGTLFANAGP